MAHGSRRHALRSLVGRIVGLALVVTTLALGFTSAPSSAAPPGGDRGEKKPTPAQLSEPGVISGTISAEGGGWLSGGNVDLYRWDADGQYFDWMADTEIDGYEDEDSFSFEVEPGDYYLALSPWSRRYIRSYSGGALEPPVDPAGAGVVRVDPGAAVSADLVARLDPDLREVTGRVVDNAGNPLEWVDLELYRDLGDGETDYLDSTETNEDGEYSLEATPGDYIVYLYGSSEYDSMSVEFTVAEEDEHVVLDDIVMLPAGHWSVSGTITGPQGAVEDAEVRLYRLYGTPGDWDDYEWEDETYTDADGRYSFENVRGGASRHYTIRVSAEGFLTTYYANTPSYWEADGFTLSADRSGVDVALTEASTISGVATLAGQPVSGLGVALYRWMDDGAGSGSFSWRDSVDVGTDGTYSFAVGLGSYALYFDASGSSEPVESGWRGGGVPMSPSDPGVITVGETGVDLTADMELRRSRVATGTVLNEASDPIKSASVTAFVWDEDYSEWWQHHTAFSKADGTFAVRVPEDSTVTFRVARGGYQAAFYGGGSSLPDAPTAENSILTTGEDAALEPIVLSLFAGTLGKVAGQKLNYCLNETLSANDDEYSDAVELPFDLSFFGTPYDEIYVNNNGNVTFNEGLYQYTPSDLTGETDRPIIAPFFADVDTRGAESNIVTYGASPDGNTFRVNWADVGYYDEATDKLNTFQLLLTKNTTGAGRGPGDFDITFNYDQILWETGDASGGENGYGGTSAAAGFSAGTGQPGTFVQLPGSFVNDALLDGGENALTESSQGSSQVGRYVFQVRNNSGEAEQLGGIEGTVLRKNGLTPINHAYVQACRLNGTGCSYAFTGSDGSYSFTAIPAATYNLRVRPLLDADVLGGGADVTVLPGEVTEADPILLSAPTPPPAEVKINGSTSTESVPSVNFVEPIQFELDGCPAVESPTYTVRLVDGTVLRNQLPLTESPAGHYTASIEPLVPHTGDATISTNVPLECGGDPVEFNIYIDPSGIVTDQYGRPIEDVEVTLLRSETADGAYEVVPDGSTIMSESNRANPSSTDSTGYFRWDVTAGWYKVRSAVDGCATQTTGAMEVPPERVDLLIKLDCEVAAPFATTAPTVQGVAQVGRTIRPVSGAWPAPLVEAKLELLRNGVPVTLQSGGYTLTGSDVGATFVARSTGQRPDYVQENGTGEVVTFSTVEARSASVIGTAAPAVTPPSQTPGTPGTPTTPGTPSTPAKSKASVAVKAPKQAKAKKKTTVKVTVTGAASPTGLVTVYAGKKVIGKITLTAASKGVATFKVKLKPGKHTLRATYGGSPTVEPASSATAKVKVTKPKKKGKKGKKGKAKRYAAKPMLL